jgi:DNA polymerase V
MPFGKMVIAFQKCGVMLGDFYSQGVAQYKPRSNSEQLDGINYSRKGRV